MIINGKRKFNYNGRRYLIQKDPKGYYITAETDNGTYGLLYNIYNWNIEYFKTIKDAQRYVRDWDFVLDFL